MVIHMKKAIVGKKLGMTQVFTPDGRLLPVTVIEAGPNTVVQKKTKEKDGYEAIQVGFGAFPSERRAERLLTKPVLGHFKKAGVAPARRLREFRLDDCAAYEVGAVIQADVFAEGEKVDVSGISRGRGFTGAIYRWNQHTGPMKHGSKYHRGVGSMGANSTPSRVFKNKHMPGHYGVEKVTIQNLTVIRVDAERNLLLVRGAVPGPNGGYLTVRNAIKA
jgi:large subunit ribosomal protein L3